MYFDSNIKQTIRHKILFKYIIHICKYKNKTNLFWQYYLISNYCNLIEYIFLYSYSLLFIYIKLIMKFSLFLFIR